MLIKKGVFKDRVFVLGVFGFLLFCVSGVVSGQIKVANLKNTNVAEGCACGFQTVAEAKKRNAEKFLFLSELGEDVAGWMNIDGEDVKLKLVKTTENTNRSAKVGRRFYEEYSAPGVKVRIDYVTKWVCPPNVEACEEIHYNVTITVTKGKKSKIVKATGACGC